MNNEPMSGYPENPEQQPRLKQIKTLIERHNFLVDQVSILEIEFKEKYEKLHEFKKILQTDIKLQKQALERNTQLIQTAEIIKKATSKNFKQIIKKPAMNKLEQRIDDLNYEDFIYRAEFLKKIDFKKKN